jgi:hypothetical protein
MSGNKSTMKELMAAMYSESDEMLKRFPSSQEVRQELVKSMERTQLLRKLFRIAQVVEEELKNRSET